MRQRSSCETSRPTALPERLPNASDLGAVHSLASKLSGLTTLTILTESRSWKGQARCKRAC
jgi:hypothetical protein